MRDDGDRPKEDEYQLSKTMKIQEQSTLCLPSMVGSCKVDGWPLRFGFVHPTPQFRISLFSLLAFLLFLLFFFVSRFTLPPLTEISSNSANDHLYSSLSLLSLPPPPPPIHCIRSSHHRSLSSPRYSESLIPFPPTSTYTSTHHTSQMGCCISQDDKESRNRHEDIESQLRRDRIQMRNEVKMLLLGNVSPLSIFLISCQRATLHR